MTPWWLITLGGLLGSAHCVGMCGGFAVMLGVSRTSWWDNLRTQLIYSSGRIVSYTAFGAIAGYCGRELTARMPTFINVPAWLSFLAGLFLIWEGVHAAGWRRKTVTGRPGTGCLMSPLLSSLLRYPALRHTFVAGVFTAFLPCGLVYAFVSLAASQGDLLQGAGVMLAFGLGTVPLMVATGIGAMWLPVGTRQRLWSVAAWSVVLTGALTVGRGVAFLTPSDAPPAERCPMCRAVDTASNQTVIPVPQETSR